MVWFTRFSRFADVHLVLGQERGQACGPASMAMVIAKLKKLSAPGAIQSEEAVRQAYAGEMGGSSDFVTNSGRASGLARTLNTLQCGTWVSEAYSYDKLIESVGVSSAFSGPIVNVTPAIPRIKWTNGGGHFVVVDTIRSLMGTHYATVCDPWDANVHVQAFNKTAFTYNAKPQLHVNFGGSADHIRSSRGKTTTTNQASFEYKAAGSTGSATHIIYRSAA